MYKLVALKMQSDWSLRNIQTVFVCTLWARHKCTLTNIAWRKLPQKHTSAKYYSTREWWIKSTSLLWSTIPQGTTLNRIHITKTFYVLCRDAWTIIRRKRLWPNRDLRKYIKQCYIISPPSVYGNIHLLCIWYQKRSTLFDEFFFFFFLIWFRPSTRLDLKLFLFYYKWEASAMFWKLLPVIPLMIYLRPQHSFLRRIQPQIATTRTEPKMVDIDQW